MRSTSRASECRVTVRLRAEQGQSRLWARVEDNGVGGAAVLPGYAVLADDSGVLFIAPEDLDAVLEEGELKTERGRVNEAKVTEGTHLGQLSGATKMVEGKLGQ